MKRIAFAAILLFMQAAFGQEEVYEGDHSDTNYETLTTENAGSDETAATEPQTDLFEKRPAVESNNTMVLPSQPTVVRLFIGRPNSFGFGRGGKNVWVAPLIETFLHVRLSAGVPVKVIPFETVRLLVAEANDYARPIAHHSSLQTVRSARPVLDLSTEYEALSDGRFRVFMRLALTGAAGIRQEYETTFDPGTLDDSLTVALKRLIGGFNEAGWSLDLRTQGRVLPQNSRIVQRTGEALLKGLRETPSASAGALERLYREDDRNPAALYGAVLLYRSAGNYDKALAAIQSVSGGTDGSYPIFAVGESELLRHAQRAQEARAALSRAQAGGIPRYLLIVEQGRIEEALNDFPRARSTYSDALSIDETDPEPYRGLIRVCLLQGDTQQARSYSAQWMSLTSRSSSRSFCEVGNELLEGNHIDAAVSAFGLCVEDSSTNADGWRALADVLHRQGNDSAAAESYLYLYAIDHARFRDAPITAGELMEKAGHPARAREAYEMVLARRRGEPQATLRLARLDYKEGRCDDAVARLKPLVSSGVKDTSIVALLSACNTGVADNVWDGTGTESGQRKRNPGFVVRNIASVSLGVLAAAGFGAGIYLNSDIPQIHERYKETRNPDEITRLHDKLATTRDNRNRLYAAAACLAGGFAVTILLPGR